MNIDLGRLHAFDRAHSGLQRQQRLRNWAAVLLVVGAMVMIGLRWGGSEIAADTDTVTFCVTEHGSPAEPMLRTALSSSDESGSNHVANGVTAHNGCGEFGFVPTGRVYVISVWSADGKQVGKSARFMVESTMNLPTIRIDEPGVPVRLALH